MNGTLPGRECPASRHIGFKSRDPTVQATLLL
jgi:hypothetical protein